MRNNKAYKDKSNNIIGMHPSDLTGSLDDFFLDLLEGIYGRNISIC